MPLPVEPPPYLDLREQGLYAINMNIKKLEKKLEDAEAEWQACDGSASMERLNVAFHNRVYLKTTVGKQLADQKRLSYDFQNAP